MCLRTERAGKQTNKRQKATQHQNSIEAEVCTLHEVNLGRRRSPEVKTFMQRAITWLDVSINISLFILVARCSSRSNIMISPSKLISYRPNIISLKNVITEVMTL